MKYTVLSLLLSCMLFSACRHESAVQPEPVSALKEASFGAGCFWCSEALLEQLEGVEDVIAGYAGGIIDNPSYEQVASGTSGYAEVVRVRYDPVRISYPDLLEAFWQTHDPTIPVGAGPDNGPQYRSVIFFHDEKQRSSAEYYKGQLDSSGAFSRPVLTEILPLGKFYRAEAEHQDFFRKNPDAPYCRSVIIPRLEKFREVFALKLKK